MDILVGGIGQPPSQLQSHASCGGCQPAGWHSRLSMSLATGLGVGSAELLLTTGGWPVCMGMGLGCSGLVLACFHPHNSWGWQFPVRIALTFFFQLFLLSPTSHLYQSGLNLAALVGTQPQGIKQISLFFSHNKGSRVGKPELSLENQAPSCSMILSVRLLSHQL